MKKIILSLLAVVFLIAGSIQSAVAVESKVIKVGAFNNYPLIFRDTDGDIKGIYVDLLSEIGKKENITFEYVFGSWNEGLDKIKSGEVDVLTSVGYTDERSTYMDFTKNPVLTVWGELYADKGTDIKGILDVENKKIGVMRGDINAANFSELISKFELQCQITEFESYDDVFAAVEKKEVEAGVAGLTFGMGNATKYNLKSTGIVFNPISLYFATAKGKNEQLILTLDKYLIQWRNEDKSFFDVSKQKWMGVVVEKAVVHTWFWQVLFGLGVMFFISTIFIVSLKMQIKRATEKVMSEAKAQKESEEKYKFLVDKMQEIAFIVDEKGMIKFANKITFELLGYSDDEILEKSIEDFLTPDSYQKAAVSIGQEFLGKAQPGFEAEVKKKGGEIRIWQISGASTPVNEGGKMVGLLVSATDITTKKAAEKELEESKTVLQSKVEELEKFQKLTIDRELKMAELKEDMEEMKKKQGGEKGH